MSYTQSLTRFISHTLCFQDVIRALVPPGEEIMYQKEEDAGGCSPGEGGGPQGGGRSGLQRVQGEAAPRADGGLREGRPRNKGNA